MWLFKRLCNPTVELTVTITGTLMLPPSYVGLVPGPEEGDFLFCNCCFRWDYITMLTYFALLLLHYSFRPGESFSRVPRWNNKMNKLFWDFPVTPFKVGHILLFLLKISSRIFQSWHSRLKTSASVQTGRLRSWQEGKLVQYSSSFWESGRIFHFMAKLAFFPHIFSCRKFLGMSLWGPKEKKAKKIL